MKHLAICKACPERALCRKMFQPGATCEHWPAEQEPGLPALAVRAGKEIAHWVAEGMPLAHEEERRRRLEICAACPHWDKQAFLNTGRCRHPKCGCSSAKHALMTSRCPMGKWEK